MARAIPVKKLFHWCLRDPGADAKRIRNRRVALGRWAFFSFPAILVARARAGVRAPRGERLGPVVNQPMLRKRLFDLFGWAPLEWLRPSFKQLTKNRGA